MGEGLFEIEPAFEGFSSPQICQKRYLFSILLHTFFTGNSSMQNSPFASSGQLHRTRYPY